MPTTRLRLGLSVDEHQFQILEWMRGRLMTAADEYFPRFQTDIGLGVGNVLHIPLIDFTIVNASWPLDTVIAMLVSEDGRVRPEIAQHLPGLRVRFGKRRSGPSATWLEVFGTLELASHIAHGIMTTSYPENTEIVFAHPQLMLGSGRDDFATCDDLPPTEGMETISRRAVLLDVTEGYGKHAILATFSLAN